MLALTYPTFFNSKKKSVPLLLPLTPPSVLPPSRLQQMTYVKQLEEYEEAVMRKRLEEMPEQGEPSIHACCSAVVRCWLGGQGVMRQLILTCSRCLATWRVGMCVGMRRRLH